MFPATISFLISMDSAPAEIRGRECRQILETARSHLEDNDQDNMNSISAAKTLFWIQLLGYI